MPPVDRNNPIRADYSESTYSLMEFMREFPDDAACLDWLWRNRYAEDGSHADCPKCERNASSTRSRRPAWDCDSCGHHLHPLAGTIFHKSSTSLHLWFYAIYLITSTRCGISAKQLERELGVTYKTAWRMFTLIRNKLMTDDGTPFTGQVEADETSVDGRPRKGYSCLKAAWTLRPMPRNCANVVERPSSLPSSEADGSRRPCCHPGVGPPCTSRSLTGSADRDRLHRRVARLQQAAHRFAAHSRVRHAAGEYVNGTTHTNTIEGFFGHLKPSIRGTYRKVSHKWLQGYLNEYVALQPSLRLRGDVPGCSCSGQLAVLSVPAGAGSQLFAGGGPLVWLSWRQGHMSHSNELVNGGQSESGRTPGPGPPPRTCSPT